MLAVSQAVASTGAFLPSLFAAIIIAAIGVVVGAVVKNVTVKLLGLVRFESWFGKTTFGEALAKTEPGLSVTTLTGELTKWFVVVVFLIPAVEVLGLKEATAILRDILFFVPNVAVAVLIVFLGTVFARFAHDFILTAATGLGSSVAHVLAVIGRWSILVFAMLAALSRLGIASDLIRILFTGFVAMVALAGGLAFGLGGREVATQVLDRVRSELARRK